MSKKTDRTIRVVKGAIWILFPHKAGDIPGWVWDTAKRSLPATIDAVKLLNMAAGLSGAAKHKAVCDVVRDMLDECLDFVPGLSDMGESRRDKLIGAFVEIIYQVAVEAENTTKINPIYGDEIHAIESEIIAGGRSKLLARIALK